MAIATFDDHGIRFVYPIDWELEVTDEGSVATIAVQSSKDPAFLFVTLDQTRPEPKAIAEQALEAMREEYPLLDADPVEERINGQTAYGHDVEFISLDLTNCCSIRCYRTPNRTVLFFGQWSDLEEDTAEEVIRAVRSSLEETD